MKDDSDRADSGERSKTAFDEYARLVISAHWQFDVDKAESAQRNSGIAIVSFRESVLEVLQHPRLIEMREVEKKKRAKATAPTLDDAQKPKRRNRDIEIPPVNRGRFFGDLTKATRKRKP
jgi:hypothetical protein